MTAPIVSYTAPATDAPYAVPFPYLDQDHVVVEVDGVELSSSAYTWPTSSSIQLVTPATAGASVKIFRRTPAGPLTSYQGGTTVTTEDLDVDSKQALYRAAEVEVTSLLDEFSLLTEEGLLIGDGDGIFGGGGGDGTAAAAALQASLAAATAGSGTDLVSYPDPIAPAFLKTTSDIINGERVSLLRGIAKTKWAGIAAGTNTDDLSADINAMFQAMKTAKRGELWMPRGTYTSGQIKIPSGVKLRSDGAILKAHSSLSTSQPLFRNEISNGGAGVRTDAGIHVEGIHFIGSGADDRTVELVDFLKVQDLVVRNCKVSANRYIGMAFGGCGNVVVENVEVTDFGKNIVTAEGGAALWFGPYGDGTTASDYRIINPYIHDGEWAGIYFSPVSRLAIINPHIVNVKEAGIFGTASGLQILGGQVVGVTKKYISASGVDFGGVDAVIGGGLVIAECDNTGLVLADAQSVLVSGIKTRNMRRDATAYPTGSHIAITSFSASPNQPRDITITGCTSIDYSSPSTAAVRLEGQAPGGLVIDVLIADNNFAGTTWTSNKAVYINQSYVGSNVTHRGNLGNDDTAAGALATRSTAQTLTTGLFGPIQFDDASTINSRGPTGSTFMWSGATPSRITCYEAGRVSISGQVCFTGNASGIRAVEIRKNGSASGAAAMPKSKANNIGVAYAQQVNVASAVVNVAAGDYFELYAMQDSGSDLTTEPGISQTWFSVRYVQ